jgi:hypothetical protein
MNKQDQQPEVTDKETERFYNISYFIIPIPILAGLAFAAWVLITEDSRDQSYCVIASSASAYKKDILQAPDFTYRESITLDICKEKDEAIDDSDGRKSGKVRWFICKGTTCGPDWEHALVEK